jgi:hypothetical protein
MNIEFLKCLYWKITRLNVVIKEIKTYKILVGNHQRRSLLAINFVRRKYCS